MKNLLAGNTCQVCQSFDFFSKFIIIVKLIKTLFVDHKTYLGSVGHVFPETTKWLVQNFKSQIEIYHIDADGPIIQTVW